MALLEEIAGEQQHRDEHQSIVMCRAPAAASKARAREARLRESPDDQHEADRRQERIDPLPWALAEPRDRLLARGFRRDAGRVKPEKDDEAEHQNRHRNPP